MPDPAQLLSPLEAVDPPRLGSYWLDARLLTATSGIAYTGHSTAADGAASEPVMLVRLSEGSSADAAARDRFAGLINKLPIDTVLARGGQGQDTGKWARKFVPEQGPTAIVDDLPASPWVALAYDQTGRDVALADHLLSEVELRTLEPQGAPSGPEYRHYWLNRVQPRVAKIWPLPWPGRAERAGWQTLLISWLLMLLLGALAVLIAILLFHNQPPMSPPSPTGGSGSATATASDSSSSSASPSPSPQDTSSQSASPSPSPQDTGSQSASPSPSPGESGSESASPSPTDGGTESGGSSESPRSRL